MSVCFRHLGSQKQDPDALEVEGLNSFPESPISVDPLELLPVLPVSKLLMHLPPAPGLAWSHPRYLTVSVFSFPTETPGALLLGPLHPSSNFISCVISEVSVSITQVRGEISMCS